MIGIDKNSLPFQTKITYPMIKYIRLSRNCSQAAFGEICRIDQSVLAKLERGEIQLSPNYETRILNGMRELRITNVELVSIKKLTEMKAIRG